MQDTDRLEALEFKVSHLERGLQELSDVVLRQQRELERVTLRNEQLLRQLDSLLAEQEANRDPHEIPPHY